MAGEGRVPSTKGARIKESEGGDAARATKTSTAGTGQQVSAMGRSERIADKGATIGRAEDRPSKSGSAPSKSTDSDKRPFAQDNPADISQRHSAIAPSVEMPSVVMYRDDAAKSSRERSFSGWVSDNKEHLIGSGERDYFPTPLERGTQAEIAKGDGYAGTANKVSKPKNQAQ